MVRTLALLILYLTLLMPITPARLGAESDLDYQNRGARYEGCKPKPVSAFDIKLILFSRLQEFDPISCLISSA
jgi:hypothetical protein